MKLQQKIAAIIAYVTANPNSSQKQIAQGAFGRAQTFANPTIKALVRSGRLVESGTPKKLHYAVAGAPPVPPVALPPIPAAVAPVTDPHRWAERVKHALMLFIAANKLTLPVRWPNPGIHREFSWGDFTVVDQGVPHVHPHSGATLGRGNWGLYVFCHNDVCLKIGIATTQLACDRHYGYKHRSTLAKSMKGDANSITLYPGFNPPGPKPWMLQNLRRINITFSGANLNPRKFLLKHLEAFFHSTFQPRYEG
jgi:hypothetical protein